MIQSTTRFAVSVYPRLTITYDFASHLLTWEELCSQVLRRGTYTSKESAPLFGPYALYPNPRTKKLSRCDACVTELSMAVFDVDQGDEAAVDLCRFRLARTQHLFYSTYSHSAARPSYRLVIPLAAPIEAAAWYSVRSHLMSEFTIPCDPNTSKGVSHAYYVPSSPPGRVGVDYVGAGALYRAPHFYVPPAGFISGLEDFEAREEDAVPVDIEPMRVALTRRAAQLQREQPQKAERLRRCLAGEPIADAGGRDQAMTSLTSLIVYALPDVSVATVRRLVEPSYRAMRALGSKLTMTSIETKIRSAMRKKAERDAEYTSVVEAYEQSFNKLITPLETKKESR